MPRRQPPDTHTPSPPAWTSKLRPAPGELRIVQAFVNTANLEKGTDELRSPAHLANWLALWRLSPTVLELGKPELERTVDLRETLRDAAGANNGGTGGAAAVRKLDRMAASSPVLIRLAASGNDRLEPTSDGFDGALGKLLGIVAAARIAGLWPRFKTCANEECRAAFYDLSKNRAGKWCSMQRCGNRLNARLYQRRRRKKLNDYLRHEAYRDRQRLRKLQRKQAAQQSMAPKDE